MNAVSPAPNLTPEPPDVGDQDRGDDDSDPGSESIRRPARPRSPGPRNSGNTLAIRRLANRRHVGPTGSIPVYTYRYLDPLAGRRVSRDRIEEDGGINLYGFVENAAAFRTDLNGNKAWPLIPVWEKITPTLLVRRYFGLFCGSTCCQCESLRETISMVSDDIRKLEKDHEESIADKDNNGTVELSYKVIGTMGGTVVVGDYENSQQSKCTPICTTKEKAEYRTTLITAFESVFGKRHRSYVSHIHPRYLAVVTVTVTYYLCMMIYLKSLGDLVYTPFGLTSAVYLVPRWLSEIAAVSSVLTAFIKAFDSGGDADKWFYRLLPFVLWFAILGDIISFIILKMV